MPEFVVKSGLVPDTPKRHRDDALLEALKTICNDADKYIVAEFDGEFPATHFKGRVWRLAKKWNLRIRTRTDHSGPHTSPRKCYVFADPNKKFKNE